MGVVAAEWRKARKRTGLWIVLTLLFVTLVLFGYTLTYVFVSGTDGELPGMEGIDLIADLLPDAAVAQAVGGMAGFGGAFAVIVGVLLTGSEYGWSTVKTMATQGPSRLTLVGAKLLLLVAISVATGVTYVLTALASSAVIGAVEGGPQSWPSALDIVAGMGAASLIFGLWALLGALLGTLFRGVGLALGLGLVWALIVEQLSVALPFPERVGEIVRAVLITPNGAALAAAFGDLEAAGFGPTPVDAVQAAIVLGAYTVVAAVVTVLVFLRRDIT